MSHHPDTKTTHIISLVSMTRDTLSKAIQDARDVLQQLEDLSESPILYVGYPSSYLSDAHLCASRSVSHENPPSSLSSAQLAEVDGHVERCQLSANSLGVRLAEIRRTRNSTVPIGRLPLEILTLILELSIESWGRLRNTQRLTSVCCSWMHVLETSPQFWTMVTCDDDPGLVQKAIKLSDPLPLTLFYSDYIKARGDRPDNYWQDTVQLVMCRCKFLDLMVYDADCLRFLDSVQAPMLEKLSLFTSSSPQITVAAAFDLFNGAAPKLQHIDLHGWVEIRWQSDIFTNLRELHLRHMRASGPSISELMGVLSQNPELEVLQLILDGRTITSLPHDMQPIELRHLHTLDLGCLQHAAAEYLLAHIGRPSCRTLSFALGPDPIPYSTFTQVVDYTLQIVSKTACDRVRLLLDTPFLSIPDAHFMCSARTDSENGSHEVAWQLPPWTPPEHLSYITTATTRRLGDFRVEVTFSWNCAGEDATPRISFLARLPHVTTFKVSRVDAIRTIATYLSHPQVVDGAMEWPHPDLANISFPSGSEDYFPEILQMVRRRYGLEPRSSEGEVRPPVARLEMLSIVAEDYDEEVWAEIEAIVGKDHTSLRKPSRGGHDGDDSD